MAAFKKLQIQIKNSQFIAQFSVLSVQFVFQFFQK